MHENRRKKYLIQPRIQLLYTLVFMTTAGLYVLLQAILLHWNMTRISENVPAGGEQVLTELLTGLKTNLLITFLLLVPLTLSIGIMVTFRVAGPLYRFEVFLKQIIAGEKPQDCHIRKDDELQELCRLLNEATAPLRVRDDAPRPGGETEPVDSVPSLVGEARSEAPAVRTES